MRMIYGLVIILAVSLVLLQPVTAGEVYTWTDTDGNIHIADKPPTDGSPVDRIIRYSNRPASNAPPEPTPQPIKAEQQQLEQLKKRLKRLNERHAQLETIIAENQAAIAMAQKDADYYRKRRGSYGRRNVKAIERQLVVLNNNLTTYQSDQRYVVEDIAEIEQRIKTIKQRSDHSGSPTRSIE